MKYLITSVFRSLGLIKQVDNFHFYYSLIKTYNLRKQFRNEHPDVKLPPAYFIYETFNLNYNGFYDDSIETAKWLVEYFRKYKRLENISILDWGCGPGRIITHLPSFVDKSCKLYGTDYNQRYINWCKENISNVSFQTNTLDPPLKFDANSMDIVYGISIFTHLSKESHLSWFNELLRILKPGGIIFITLQGIAFKEKLTNIEKAKFDQGELVVKSKTLEGHRTFSAFQPVDFVKELIGNNEILEHIPGDNKSGKPQQDIWIIRKRIS